MEQKPNRKSELRRAALDILPIAWVFSAIPLLIQFASGFSIDTAPDYSPAFWIFLGIFATFQIGTTVVCISSRKLDFWSIAAVCLSILAFYPEMFVAFFAVLLYPLALGALATITFILVIRLVKRRLLKP